MVYYVLGAGRNGIENKTKSSHGVYIYPNLKIEEIPPHEEYRKFRQGDLAEQELGATSEKVGERLGRDDIDAEQ